MPLEEGGTVETHGALLDLADFQDDDKTGVKVTISLDRVRVKTDSYSFRATSVWLDADDTEALGRLLIAKADELRIATGQHDHGWAKDMEEAATGCVVCLAEAATKKGTAA